MPHQCTECSRTFPDGSKEMLSGCPDCGGNKFQFKPADAVDVGAESGGAASVESSGGEESAGAMSRAASTVRDLVGRGGESSDAASARDPISSPPSTPSEQNASQSSPSASQPNPSASQSGTSQPSAQGSTPSASSDPTGPGEGSWPKSGTESYDTPAEKAERREDASASYAESSTSTRAGGVESSVDAGRTEPSVDAGSTESSVDAGSTEPSAGASSTEPSADARGAEPSVDAGGAEASGEDESSITAQMNESEDDAQRSARSDVVSPDELPSHETPDAGTSAPGDVNASERADRPPSRGSSTIQDRQSAGDVASEPDEESPNLDELREELNSQFESIKVLDPGKYELNLMELYDREEYIISLQEDGRYVIEVPESWRGDASPD